MAVFVPFVLPGERVDADVREEKSGFARASVKQLIEASPERISTPCPYFQQCGGCQYQHIPYERQLAFKDQIWRETLQRVGKVEFAGEIRMHASPPFNYRNRVRLQVRTVPHFSLGYNRFASREFLPIRECPIASPLINRTLARLLELDGLHCPAEVEELELFANDGDEQILSWAVCKPGADEPSLTIWAEAVRASIQEISGITRFSSRRRDDDVAPAELKLLASSGAQSLTYRVASHDYHVSAGAFFQVNRHLIDELVPVVTERSGGETALDLYAGVGLFSLPLARSFHHIFAVEASQLSLRDLRQNVPASVKVVGSRTEEYLSRHSVRKRPDLVVLDPPRTGVGKAVARALVELEAQRIHYVSCDPATLARDLASLLSGGYRIEEAHIFDLFPETFHIESVVKLAR